MDLDEEKNDQDNKANTPQKTVDQEGRTFCTICIEDFQDEETIKILPCFHQFHQSCIDDWLLRKTNCPVCKFDVNSASNQLNALTN